MRGFISILNGIFVGLSDAGETIASSVGVIKISLKRYYDHDTVEEKSAHDGSDNPCVPVVPGDLQQLTLKLIALALYPSTTTNIGVLLESAEQIIKVADHEYSLHVQSYNFRCE